MIVTGIVVEFDGATELIMITNPPTPLEFFPPVTFTTDFPQKVTDVTIEDLQVIATGEQWEQTVVRLSNVRMLNNDIGSGQATIAIA